MNGQDYIAFSIARDEVPWLVAATIRLALVRVLGHLGAPDSPLASTGSAEPVSRTREEIDAMTEAEALAQMATPHFRQTCAEITARIVAGEPMTLGNVAEALGVPFAMLAEALSVLVNRVVPGLHGVVIEATETLQ